MFTPGAGCTVPTKLVRPGDELIFNASYNPGEWTTESSMKTEYDDTSLPQSCPSNVCVPSGCNFNESLSDEQLIELGHKNFSEETMK